MQLGTLHFDTPVIESLSYSADVGSRVWLKMDALQPSGSFKIRGIGFACQVYKSRGAKRFIASSGGNAGLAVAYAGRKLEVAVTVVVPESTKPRAIELIKREGAEVLIHGESWQEAHEYALSLVTDEAAYLHPFDDPLIWEGHGSVIDEVVNEIPKPDLVVLSVGGGGLLCGAIQGLERNGWGDVPILCAETEGAASLAASINAGELVAIDGITTIATSLGAKQVARQAFDYAMTRPVESILVSDKEALAGVQTLLDEHRVLVEPACGASLAALKKIDAANLKNILVVVCGGVGITSQILAGWNS